MFVPSRARDVWEESDRAKGGKLFCWLWGQLGLLMIWSNAAWKIKLYKFDVNAQF